MFTVIRLPTKFSRSIKRFSEKEKAELLGMLIDIGEGTLVTLPDTIVGDTISLIYGEWMNMESKNGNKPEKPLIQYSSESVGQVKPSNTTPRVEYNIVEYNRVEGTNIKIFDAESFEYKVSKGFLDYHLQEQTASILVLVREKGEDYIINKWSDEVRKLKEIDNFTEKQIQFIIDFTLKDDFWKYQILSIGKFRKKKDGISYFVKMIDKAKENKRNNLPINKNVGTL